jgi:hypothetical protein
MEPTATPTYTAKNLCLLFLHITIYTSAFLLLLIPMTQDPQSTTCIALRALGLALNFIRPALFSPFIRDQSYVAIEYMCFNTSLISIVMTYSKLPLLLHKFTLTSHWYSSSRRCYVPSLPHSMGPCCFRHNHHRHHYFHPFGTGILSLRHPTVYG